MKITFTRGTALGGTGNDAYPGDVHNLPDTIAQRLIVQGRAVAGDHSVKRLPVKVVTRPAAPAEPTTESN